jgi:hypothetical protein
VDALFFCPAQQQLPAGQSNGLVLPQLGADRLYSRSFDGLGLQVRLVVQNVFAFVIATA